MSPASAIPSPLMRPPDSRISLRAMWPAMMAPMAPMTGITTYEAIPSERLTMAVVLVGGEIGDATECCGRGWPWRGSAERVGAAVPVFGADTGLPQLGQMVAPGACGVPHALQ